MKKALSIISKILRIIGTVFFISCAYAGVSSRGSNWLPLFLWCVILGAIFHLLAYLLTWLPENLSKIKISKPIKRTADIDSFSALLTNNAGNITPENSLTDKKDSSTIGTMYCRHCGKKLAIDSKFCSYCGGRIDSAQDPLSFFKNNRQMVIWICTAILWIVFSIVLIESTSSYHKRHEAMSIILLIVTPIILYLIRIANQTYNHYCIDSFSRTDSNVIRALKIVYLIFTLTVFCIAGVQSCSDGIGIWLAIVGAFWVLPVIVIYLVRYYLYK